MGVAVTNPPPEYKGTLNLKQVAAALAKTGGNKAAAARAIGAPITTFKRAVTYLPPNTITTKCVIVQCKEPLPDCDGCGVSLTPNTAVYLDASNKKIDKPVCKDCYERSIRKPSEGFKKRKCMPSGPYSSMDRRRKGAKANLTILRFKDG